jgi:hypothetical protein
MADCLEIARAVLAVCEKPEPKLRGAGADMAELERANAVLGRAGVRLMTLESGETVGLWSDLDSADIRSALRTLGLDQAIRYLDEPGMPLQYKIRKVEGEPVPMDVLAEMERYPAEPWNLRNRMLNTMGWCSKGIPWAEWKTAELNRLLQRQVATGKTEPDCGSNRPAGERKVGQSLRT